MNDQPGPLTEQQLEEYEAIAAHVVADPFYLSDCEGSLQVWHERALARVTRNNAGAITSYDFPFAFPPAEQIIELDLDSWDPGEDATDDKRRQDIGDLVEARAALPALVTEVRLLRAQLDAEKSAHRFTLRQRNNRSNRLIELRDLAIASDSVALLAAAKDTLAASRHDHDDCWAAAETGE